MDIKAYLERIGYSGSLAPTAATLRALQVAHLLTVPFENLSIHAGQPILLELTNPEAFFQDGVQPEVRAVRVLDDPVARAAGWSAPA